MVKNFEDICIRFDTTHERDRHTDRHRMTAEAALMHCIARQKQLGRKIDVMSIFKMADLRHLGF